MMKLEIISPDAIADLFSQLKVLLKADWGSNISKSLISFLINTFPGLYNVI